MINKALKHIWLPATIVAFIFSFQLKIDSIGVTFLILTIQTLIILSILFNYKIKLITIYFTFTLIFFNLIPWMHYSKNNPIWRNIPILDYTYITLNLILFISNIITFIVYKKFTKITTSPPPEEKKVKNHNITTFFLLIISSTSFIALLYLNNFSIEQLLFRGLIDEQKEITIESSSLSLLIGMTTRMVSVFCFFYAATKIKNQLLPKILLLILFIFSVFPTGVSRYMVAFAYIPLILLFIPQLRKSSLFSGTLIFSLIFFFPFLDQFRNFSGLESLKLLPSTDFFFAAHFDAYENFASAIENNFITYGNQLLGVLFFFIPRVFWPSKPVGSGYEMAEQTGYAFNNISMPFLGEGYVNFGLSGVLIFSFIIGNLMARIDYHFSIINLRHTNSYNLALYYFLIGSLFFMLRGDLLSSTAYISAGLFSWFFVGLMCSSINKARVVL